MADFQPSARRTSASCADLDSCTRSLLDARSRLAVLTHGPAELTHLSIIPSLYAGELGRVSAPPRVSPSDVQPILPAAALPGHPLIISLVINDAYPAVDLGTIAAALAAVKQRLVVAAALIPIPLPPPRHQRLVLPVSVSPSPGKRALLVSVDVPVLPVFSIGRTVVIEELSLTGVSLLQSLNRPSIPVVLVCNDARSPGATWHATMSGDVPELLATLLDGGSTEEASGYDTCLRVAIRRGRPDVVTALVRAGADVNGTLSRHDARSPLRFAVSNMQADCIAALLESADINVNAGRGHAGGTVLHLACLNPEIGPCLRLLLAVPGIDVDARDSEGGTALHVAAAHGASEAVAMLLAAGASPNARNFGGETPLHLAMSLRCIAPLLAAPGVDVNAASLLGLTPLHIAVSYGACLKALLAAPGLNPNPRNANGETPLHRAAAMPGHEWAVRTLLDANVGVDAEVVSCGGHTPLRLAEVHGHTATAALLRQHCRGASGCHAACAAVGRCTSTGRQGQCAVQ